MATVISILLAILVLSVLILVHELGHYGAARLLGVKVEEFSMFMGPKIWSHTSKAGIQYTLRSVPIGGYCRFAGEDEESDDPQAFNKQRVWKRFIVTLAGAAMNFLFAYALAVVLCMFTGLATDMPKITAIEPGSPAQMAQMQPGDRVLMVGNAPVGSVEGMEAAFAERNTRDVKRDGQTVSEPVDVRVSVERGGKYTVLTMPADADWSKGFGATYDLRRVVGSLEEDYPAYAAGMLPGDIITAIDGVEMTSTTQISEAITAAGTTPIRLTLERDGAPLDVTLTPKFDEAAQRARIGITYKSDLVTFGSDSFAIGADKCVEMVKLMYTSLGQLFTGRANVGDMMGPVGIVTEISAQAKQETMSILPLALMISLNLGIVNLLPIPALDGSRLVFLAIEGIRRKPFPRDKEAMVHFIGLMCLFVFLLFVTFNDVKRLFI